MHVEVLEPLDLISELCSEGSPCVRWKQLVSSMPLQSSLHNVCHYFSQTNLVMPEQLFAVSSCWLVQCTASGILQKPI